MSNIEEHIRRAMQEGKFDDLPGKGKPLNLEDNPLEDPEWRSAYRILRNGGFTLPWIEMRQEIEEDIERARAALNCAWEWRQAALAQNQPIVQLQDEWERSVEAFRLRIQEINGRISAYNLQAPGDRFQRMKLDADREVGSVQRNP